MDRDIDTPEDETEKKSVEIAIQDIEKKLRQHRKKMVALENVSTQATHLAETNGAKFQKLLTLHDDAIANVNRQLIVLVKLESEIEDLKYRKDDKTNVNRIDRNLTNQVEDFDKFVSKFEFYQKSQFQQQNAMQIQMKEMAAKLEKVSTQSDRIEKNCEELKNTEFKNSNDHRFKMQQIQNKQNKTESELRTIYEKLESFPKVYASVKQFKEQVDRIDTFTEIEHIKYIRSYLLPKIINFSDKIDEFHQDNQKVRECIVRFDQDISLKAYKSELLTMEQNLYNDFVSQSLLDEQNERIKQIEKTFNDEKQKRQQDYEDFKLIQENNYHFNICDIVRDKMANYERIERQFAKFFDVEELTMTFDRKADIELIHQLNDQKATRQEVQLLQSRIEKLNERLCQVAVLQKEIAQNLEPLQCNTQSYDEESKKRFKLRIKQIFQHSNIVNNWINDQGLDVLPSKQEKLQFEDQINSQSFCSFRGGKKYKFDKFKKMTKHVDKYESMSISNLSQKPSVKLSQKASLRLSHNIIGLVSPSPGEKSPLSTRESPNRLHVITPNTFSPRIKRINQNVLMLDKGRKQVASTIMVSSIKIKGNEL